MSSSLSFVNVSVWDPDQVCCWIRGLEDAVAKYADVFKESSVDGKQLLAQHYDSLSDLNIHKFCHQEMILQSVHILKTLYFELEQDNLSTIFLHLDCLTRNLYNLLQQKASTKSSKTEITSTSLLELLSSISDIVETIKRVVPWLIRVPFDDFEYFNDVKNRLVMLASQLLTYSTTTDSEQAVEDTCHDIIVICEEILTDTKDSLTIQRSSLELVTLKKNMDEELGMSVFSSPENVHTIVQIKTSSVADVSKKIHTGDEIIQVNYQTVIGWDLSKLLNAIKNNKKEVTLTLKKKPRHVTLSGYQKKKNQPQKKQLLSAMFPITIKKSGNAKAHSRRKIMQLNSGNSESIPEQETDDNVSDSEVFHSSNLFSPQKRKSSRESTVRRATVSGGSPILMRSAIGSMESISMIAPRPKSYFPASTNISLFSTESESSGGKMLSRKYPLEERKENNSAAIPSCKVESPVSPPPPQHRRIESTGEVAEDKDSAPRLLKVVRLDSEARQQLTAKQRNESISSLDSVLSTSSASSYVSNSSNLKHKVYFKSEHDLQSPSPTNVLRRNLLRRTGLNRRISCKDLGGGDCQGYLWKKKEGIGLKPDKWSKYWFVLKHKDLYYYKALEDEKAQGVIHLPGFTISPTQESRSKKYAFKAYNKDTVFLFASERQDDMAKWMNKMGLSSLADLDTSHLTTTAGFIKPSKDAGDVSRLAYFSESDEELFSPSSSSTSSSPQQLSFTDSREDLVSLYRHIRQADVDFSGLDRKARHSTMLRKTTLDRNDSSFFNEDFVQLLSLNRTLKDKEQILFSIEEFLQKQPITSKQINEFKQQHLNSIGELNADEQRTIEVEEFVPVTISTPIEID